MAGNLYVHFPFCRGKCAYCALHSRAGVSTSARAAYVERLVRQTATLGLFDTIYFGGGTPALCELGPLFDALASHISSDAEFTVELHPLDVTDALLATLRAGGVNRISLGVQSLDDATLSAMGRGYSADGAKRAFGLVRKMFDNAGVDFIVGYPNDPCDGFSSLGEWGLSHCSVYALQLEENTRLARQVARGQTPQVARGQTPQVARGQTPLPSDDWVMDRQRRLADDLRAVGLHRYEISNYALPGFHCRHNRAVWRGEDYVGLGEGAHGRIGLIRTYVPPGSVEPEKTSLSPVEDLRERTIFRLRTDEGLDLTRMDEWSSDPVRARSAIERAREAGLLTLDAEAQVCRLTVRGSEVCDAILTDLI